MAANAVCNEAQDIQEDCAWEDESEKCAKFTT